MNNVPHVLYRFSSFSTLVEYNETASKTVIRFRAACTKYIFETSQVLFVLFTKLDKTEKKRIIVFTILYVYLEKM